MWRSTASKSLLGWARLGALSAVACFGLASGCGSPQMPRCTYPDELIQEEPEQLSVLESPGGRGIIASYVWGVSWYALQSNGSVGDLVYSWPHGLVRGAGRRVLMARPREDAFQLLLTDGVLNFQRGANEAGKTPYLFTGDSYPGPVTVSQFFAVGDELYATWQAALTPQQTSWVAGLARLDFTVLGPSLVTLGPPFHRESMNFPYNGPGLHGGWDADAQVFWIDYTDYYLGPQVYRVGLDGLVQDRLPVQGANWFWQWTRLPTGRWAGLNGGSLQIFTPLSRPADMFHRNVVPLTAGSSWSTTQYVDEQGVLWILSGAGIRRWDDGTAMLGELQPAVIRAATCDSYVGLD